MPGTLTSLRRWCGRRGVRIILALLCLAVGVTLVVLSVPARRHLGLPDPIGPLLTIAIMAGTILGAGALVRPYLTRPSD
ncbi:hypothetical protein ACQP00_32820 [Dactylosporangium sp. CS-047395]|uniref:hypothetical protein n=1 Tax=Dactylosporangium sp. CS-047395 TaxID=3239936 RepID=UPI003D93607A